VATPSNDEVEEIEDADRERLEPDAFLAYFFISIKDVNLLFMQSLSDIIAARNDKKNRKHVTFSACDHLGERFRHSTMLKNNSRNIWGLAFNQFRET
jgi:hypothetical protein